MKCFDFMTCFLDILRVELGNQDVQFDKINLISSKVKGRGS